MYTSSTPTTRSIQTVIRYVHLSDHSHPMHPTLVTHSTSIGIHEQSSKDVPRTHTDFYSQSVPPSNHFRAKKERKTEFLLQITQIHHDGVAIVLVLFKFCPMGRESFIGLLKSESVRLRGICIDGQSARITADVVCSNTIGG